jgi:hypothetical protein
MSPEWLKQLWKTADLIFQVPPGTPGWPLDMYEPLTVGIVFPFLRNMPWQLKGTRKMFYMAQKVRQMFKEQVMDSGNFLRKLLLECRRLHTLPADVVRILLYFGSSCDIPCQLIGK